MDERLEKALDFSNFRMILSTRQENLKLLMKNKLVLPYEGGLFKVDKELISLIGVLLTVGETSFIFIDKNDIPIVIPDLQDFYQEIMKKYRTVLRQYYRSYQTLSEAREIKKVINWNEEDKES